MDQVRIGKSSIHGKGVFAAKDLPKGARLKLVNEEDLWRQKEPRTLVGRYLNHATHPNTRWKSCGVSWYAETKHDIPKGTELTISYLRSPWFCDKEEVKFYK